MGGGGYHFGGPYTEGCNILRVYIGVPYFGKTTISRGEILLQPI